MVMVVGLGLGLVLGVWVGRGTSLIYICRSIRCASWVGANGRLGLTSVDGEKQSTLQPASTRLSDYEKERRQR